MSSSNLRGHYRNDSLIEFTLYLRGQLVLSEVLTVQKATGKDVDALALDDANIYDLLDEAWYAWLWDNVNGDFQKLPVVTA